MREPDDEDDAALRWEGDDDLGRMTSLDQPLRPAPREGASPGEDVADADAEDAADDVPRDLPLAIVSGVAAVLFLAETVGWILVIQRIGSAFATGSGVIDFIGAIARFLALLAAPLWFVTALRSTRRRVVRIGWFVLGLGVLVPWPLLLGVIG